MTPPPIGSTWRRRGRVAMIAGHDYGYPWIALRYLDTGRRLTVRPEDLARQWERVRLLPTAGGYEVRAWEARVTGYAVEPAPVLP